MLIVITGLDGSGTSTIAKKLKELDKTAHILKTPSTEYKCRDLVDEKVKDVSPVGHMLYYLSSNVYMSDYIRKNFNIENENVYVIRYLIDTVVSNRVAGVPIELDYNIYGNNILKPDLTLFVSVDEDKRQKRITKRGKSILDKVLDDDITRDKFIKEFEKNLDHETTIYVDNNSSDIEQTAKNTYKKIKKFEKNLNKIKNNTFDNITSNKCFYKKYTYDNYNLSSNNSNIFLLLKNIKETDKRYNPIVIYGKKGTGKTHLLSATANNLLKSDEKIVYIRAKEFKELCKKYEIEEMEEHVFTNIIDKIKESNYIFFEDIENLANSSFTENKFYHLFNDLYESDKKIIITCNKEPDKLNNIEPRIITRLYWGINWDLEKYND